MVRDALGHELEMVVSIINSSYYIINGSRLHSFIYHSFEIELKLKYYLYYDDLIVSAFGHIDPIKSQDLMKLPDV